MLPSQFNNPQEVARATLSSVVSCHVLGRENRWAHRAQHCGCRSNSFGAPGGRAHGDPRHQSRALHTLRATHRLHCGAGGEGCRWGGGCAGGSGNPGDRLARADEHRSAGPCGGVVRRERLWSGGRWRRHAVSRGAPDRIRRGGGTGSHCACGDPVRLGCGGKARCAPHGGVRLPSGRSCHDRARRRRQRRGRCGGHGWKAVGWWKGHEGGDRVCGKGAGERLDSGGAGGGERGRRRDRSQ